MVLPCFTGCSEDEENIDAPDTQKSKDLSEHTIGGLINIQIPSEFSKTKVPSDNIYSCIGSFNVDGIMVEYPLCGNDPVAIFAHDNNVIAFYITERPDRVATIQDISKVRIQEIEMSFASSIVWYTNKIVNINNQEFKILEASDDTEYTMSMMGLQDDKFIAIEFSTNIQNIDRWQEVAHLIMESVKIHTEQAD
jgi:hypothetical protein